MFHFYFYFFVYLSKLSSCIEGLQIALLPFQWQHTLITVVPSSVVPINDLCEAPTPYLIGLLKPSDNSQILPSIDSVQQVNITKRLEVYIE